MICLKDSELAAWIVVFLVVFVFSAVLLGYLGSRLIIWVEKHEDKRTIKNSKI